MRYYLDTNAVSALMKGDPELLHRLEQVEKTAVAIPQPVIAEIEYGIERLPNSKRRDALRERFELIKAEIARVEWSDSVSAAFGQIRAALEKKGQPIEDFDAAIAAHALADDATLVTGNLAHMTRVPKLRVEDWSG